MTFFGYLTGVLGASPNRVASFRSALSSIGNYVELVLDEEYPHFRNNIKGLEPVRRVNIRETLKKQKNSKRFFTKFKLEKSSSNKYRMCGIDNY